MAYRADDGLNNAPKYVASQTLQEPLPWPNSTLMQGDIGAAVTLIESTTTSTGVVIARYKTTTSTPLDSTSAGTRDLLPLRRPRVISPAGHGSEKSTPCAIRGADPRPAAT